MKKNITQLPDSLFMIIFEYVTGENYGFTLSNNDFLCLYKTGTFRKDKKYMIPLDSWNNFMDTTKLFQEMKKETRFILLQKPKNLRNGKLYSLLKNPRKQIGFQYSFQYERITDLYLLSTLYYVNLSQSNIEDASFLRNVKILYLEFCLHLMDVSALGNVEVLSLKGCTGVHDISQLGKVKELNLRFCGNIWKGLECLTDNKTLSLCAKTVSRYEMLNPFSSTINTGYLYNCEHIELFKYVENLYLYQIFSVQRISQFQNLIKLFIQIALDIDIQDLPKLQTLSFTGQNEIIGTNCRINIHFSTLPQLSSLTIAHSYLPSMMVIPIPLKRLVFESCWGCKTLELLSSVNQLSLKYQDLDYLVLHAPAKIVHISYSKMKNVERTYESRTIISTNK